jgi:hypothetical protein
MHVQAGPVGQLGVGGDSAERTSEQAGRGQAERINELSGRCRDPLCAQPFAIGLARV